MSNDRIGSHCWYKRIDLKARTQQWLWGTLRAWASDFEELNLNERSRGVGQFPVALIEDSLTNRITVVPAHLVSFAQTQPANDAP
jgi:hypothetical protein